MAQARLSVRKIREVMRLKHEARLSDRQIAAVLGSARSTVQECLKRARLATVGDAYDNAMAESFCATLERELLNRRRFKTQAEAKMAVFEYRRLV